MSDIISIIGLGYVGLPLAVEFGRIMKTIGFDINESRINELRSGYDKTLEVSKEKLNMSDKLEITSDINYLKNATVYIITVPTPLDEYNIPDLEPLKKASELVGKVLNKKDIVIYESTVYPGCTEEICVPILEKMSKLTYNKGFFCGYSPERINPGDKIHTVDKITKVTSGSTPEIAIKVDKIYNMIVKAGTHKASSIRVAEAAKVIENAQRDLNIAFVNELALIFDLMNIDTLDVLEAAGTKWNFLPFKPGLVGGHCIGVDPYYLTYKAQSIGYHPEVLLSGRKLNDNMSKIIVEKIIKLMIKKGHKVLNSRVLVLGLTFKENCPDLRNSKVIDIINELKDFGCKVDVSDPWVDEKDVENQYNLELIPYSQEIIVNAYDAIIVAVAHDKFKLLEFNKMNKTVIYDLKGILDQRFIDGRL